MATRVPAAPAEPPARAATVAKVVGNAPARERPGAGRVLWRAGPRTRGGNATWLLVVGTRATSSGRWVRVVLPIRPNGTTGWLPASRTFLDSTSYTIVISLQRRTLTLFERDRALLRAQVVVGAPATPTPRGRFALYDAVAQRRPEGFVGSWVLHLTAFSNVLEDFGGGPGRVAIHGRGGASLRSPLGSASSHGCIRVDNDVAARIARVPLGTPVIVR